MGQAVDEDALRLVIAFYCIMEPKKREQVAALAQRYANSTQLTTDQVTFESVKNTGKPRRAESRHKSLRVMPRPCFQLQQCRCRPFASAPAPRTN
jgi:hypothetical protein